MTTRPYRTDQVVVRRSQRRDHARHGHAARSHRPRREERDRRRIHSHLHDTRGRCRANEHQPFGCRRNRLRSVPALGRPWRGQRAVSKRTAEPDGLCRNGSGLRQLSNRRLVGLPDASHGCTRAANDGDPFHHCRRARTLRTYGSTATLIAATSTLPATAFETSYPTLGGNFNGTTVAANLSVDACLRRDTSNATVVCSDGAPHTRPSHGGKRTALPGAARSTTARRSGPERARVNAHALVCTSQRIHGCLNSPTGGQVWQIANNAIRIGCTPLQFALIPTTNSCDPNASPSTGNGYGTAYLNAFVFADPTGGFPTLQQDKVATGTDKCPAGGSGSASGAITRATSVVQSIDGATSSLMAVRSSRTLMAEELESPPCASERKHPPRAPPLRHKTPTLRS